MKTFSIKKIKFKNIRNFVSTEITFSTGVNLIQMPNGTGKTTALELLRSAFSGKNLERRPRDFKLHSSTVYEVPKGEFLVDFQVQNSVYTIKVELDYIHDTQNFLYFNSDKTLIDRPEELELFDPSFCKKFILDGEYAKEVFEDSNYLVRNALVDLNGLRKYSYVGRRIENIAEGLINLEDSTTQKDKRRITVSRNHIDELYYKIDTLNLMKKDISNRIDIVEVKRAMLQKDLESIESRTDLYIKEEERHKQNIKDARKEIKQKIKERVEILINPQHVFSELDIIKDNFDHIREQYIKQESINELLNDIKRDKKCICGSKLSKLEYNRLESKYLNTNLLKMFDYTGVPICNLSIFKRINESPVDFSLVIDEHNDNIKEYMRKIKTCRDKVSKQDLEELERLKDKIKKIEDEIIVLKRDLEEISTSDENVIKSKGYNLDKNIFSIKKQILKEEDKLARILKNNKIYEEAKQLSDVCETIFVEAISRVERNVIEETNKILIDIIEDKRIVVKELSNQIHLQDRSGLSEGQELTVAYCFISALFNNSMYKLPLIADSPFGKLGISIRRNLAKVIPQLFEQYIVFMTSGEKAGFIEEVLKQDYIKCITLYLNENYRVSLNTRKDFFINFDENESGENNAKKN